MEQKVLFNEPFEHVDGNVESTVKGLRYVREFIDQQSHDELINQINLQPWLTELKRRVQHYGYKYSYKSRSVNQSMKIGPLPLWAEQLALLLHNQGFISDKPDQVIVNEYEPGQGIADHVDCVPCFSNTVISLSLGSPCVMELKHKESGVVVPLLLEPRSIVVFQDDARFLWTHGIRARKTDHYEERIIHRRKRISLTFRKVIVAADALTCQISPKK